MKKRPLLFLFIHTLILLSVTSSVVWVMRVGPNNLMEAQTWPIEVPGSVVISTFTPTAVADASAVTELPTATPVQSTETLIFTPTVEVIPTSTPTPLIVYNDPGPAIEGETPVTTLTLASDVLKQTESEELDFYTEVLDTSEVQIEKAAVCPGYKGSSLVDCLYEGGEDFSFTARAQLALENGLIESLNQYDSANNAGINTELLDILTGKVG